MQPRKRETSVRSTPFDEIKKEIQDKYESIRTYVDSMNEAIKNNVEQQESLKVASNIKHNGLIDEFKNLEHRVIGYIQDQKEQISSAIGDHLNIIQRLGASVFPKEILDAILPDLKGRVDQSESELIRFKNEIHSAMDDFVSEVHKKIEAFKQEIKNQPCPLDEVKKEIKEKLDIVSMDCQNSQLRSANCEKHLNLIEKKIESIMLLIKKIDLNQQGS